ncbi:Thyroid receptor-interacting protein 11 [Triplophysa tibetana]|uniref:Thyroid receptor-interacting protein 11 n=1 Tax=Triplophysa tibetana TaxID=1572043 RepID=A0A5A9P8M7_9TELE|nr:Thyroid receptor-interacting protein 11 [Triplophysa tibetana]
MSSWLGGLGSGLGQSLGQVGGSLTSFTDQISNFTKDILLEGAEEVGDATSELHVSNSRLHELETAYTTQKSEYERLRRINAELEEKLEAAEIQVKQQSVENRTLLQQKEVEISHLKARQSGLQDEVQKLQRSSQAVAFSSDAAVLPVTTASTTTTSSSFLHRTSAVHQGFHGDEVDLSDVLWSQQEINQLSSEVHRLEAEVAHWRRVAQASKLPGSDGNGDQGEVLKLQRTIKELREEMAKEVDEHQHELAALQDAQRQKMSEISRRHREELEEYEERIEELEEQLQSGRGHVVSTPAQDTKLQELQSTIQSLQEEAEIQHRKYSDLLASLEEVKHHRTKLEREKEEAAAENAELLQNYSRLQKSVSELQARVQEQEGKSMLKAQQDSEIQTLRKALADEEKEVARLKSLNESGSKEEVEHADILELNTIIDTLRREKRELQKDKVALVEELNTAEDRCRDGESQSAVELAQEVSDLKSQLEQREQAFKQAHLDIETLTAELEVLDKQNQEATQHLIGVKDQMSLQKTQAEAEAARLQSDLSSSLDQRRTLQLELENRGEKLSQSAFSLNELHMAKQQLEDTVKELRDKLSKSQELGKELRQESSNLKRTLQEKDTEIAALRKDLNHSGEQGNELEGHRKELEMRSKELRDLRSELAEVKSSYEKVVSEDFDMKIENTKLKEESTQAFEKMAILQNQVQDAQASLSRLSLEKDTRIEALKLEKSQLESELSQIEKRLSDQAKQYQQTIEELTKARSMNASSLQTEHERMVKLNQEKDLTIAELRREVEQMVSDSKDTSEMLDITVSGQKQLTELLQEKDTFVETLKAQAAEAQEELETSVLRATQESDTLRRLVEEKDRHLGAMKEENSHLKEEFDRLRDQQSRPQPMSEPRTLDIITELETEVNQLKAARDRDEEEVQALRTVSEEQQATFLRSQHSHQMLQSELEQVRLRHEQRSLHYDRLISAKDEEIVRLQSELQRLRTQGRSQIQSIDILQEDKTNSLNGESGNEKHDLSKVEIEKLVKGIKEKETEISQLNEKNLSLTKQLDQLVVSQNELGKLSQMVLQKDLEIKALHARVSGGHSQDVAFLQQQLQAYAVEREQVLAVLNEKARENSQLRSDYHRIMDIVAAKEAALLKLQQENQRISTMSDPSGSQEMFRETIQNLSRIIREKDIEIDALTQKCQTLVSVLQTSGTGDSVNGGSGGVSSNQFEELLQERDALKQQVKKMEEWKQQVITTVRNMQHESAQLQEELHRLQGQVSADSDCSSKLSVDYTRLIQSYEQKEQKLGLLSQELAQVQQTISQLNSTKDVLLGKLDRVKESPEVPATAVSQALVPPNLKGASPQVQSESLNQELQSLQRTLAEKESMIRTLQENNHRLANSASLSKSEQRSHVDELKQVREKLESLQRSLREKDLLIKTKGDQLSQVSETLRNRENDNEVLKQAVTNLKERALILELDVKKLKEENETIAARVREKETEFRALQETNMQVSLLLREREFQFSAVNEKATAMEKMLKDKEQANKYLFLSLHSELHDVESLQEQLNGVVRQRDEALLELRSAQDQIHNVKIFMVHHRTANTRKGSHSEIDRNHIAYIRVDVRQEILALFRSEGEARTKCDKLMTRSRERESERTAAIQQVHELGDWLGGRGVQSILSLMHLVFWQVQVALQIVSCLELQNTLGAFYYIHVGYIYMFRFQYSVIRSRFYKEVECLWRQCLSLEKTLSGILVVLTEISRIFTFAHLLMFWLSLDYIWNQELWKQTHVQQSIFSVSKAQNMMALISEVGRVRRNGARSLFFFYALNPVNSRAQMDLLMTMLMNDGSEVCEYIHILSKSNLSLFVSSWCQSLKLMHSPRSLQYAVMEQKLNRQCAVRFLGCLGIDHLCVLTLPIVPVKTCTILSNKPPVCFYSLGPSRGSFVSIGSVMSHQCNPTQWTMSSNFALFI